MTLVDVLGHDDEQLDSCWVICCSMGMSVCLLCFCLNFSPAHSFMGGLGQEDGMEGVVGDLHACVLLVV